MATTKKTFWFRPGRLMKNERKNPGILAVDEKFELTAHLVNRERNCWTYCCKFRLTKGVRCPASAKVLLVNNKWTLHETDENHRCEPNRARVIAEKLKCDMKELVRHDPVKPVRKGFITELKEKGKRFAKICKTFFQRFFNQILILKILF